MFANYIKIAVRHFRKNKLFSVLNITGLAIGMAACLLILQYVSFKLSFDQFHQNADHIYRVVNDRYQFGKLIQHGTITYSGVGKAMNDDFEEVVANTRVVPAGEKIISLGEKKLNEPDALYAENTFFTVFTFPLLAGDKNTALKDPFSVVVSEELIKRIFQYNGDNYSQFIGRTLQIPDVDSTPCKIDAICKNVPQNSHLKFNLLISYNTLISRGWPEANYNFTHSDFWHYVQLKPGADFRNINSRLGAFSQSHFQGSKVSGSDETFYLQPLSKAHLYSDFEYEIGETGSASVVWGLLIMAIFIITIAWINYINLATARSTERAREVGIRKVVGGLKKQLINQFMIESAIVNLLGIVVAIGLVLLLQPAFNKLLQHNLSLSYLFVKGLSGYGIALGLLSIAFLGVIVSGFYPAFVLSSFNPITVLKGRLVSSTRGIVLRKVLVVGQFTATVALIIGSIIVFQQIDYMNKKDLGFKMDQLLVVKPPLLTQWDSSFISHTNSFKDELKTIPGVQGASTSRNVPGTELPRNFNVSVAGSQANKQTMRRATVDYEFIKLYGVKLLAGREFSSNDHNPDFSLVKNMIINASAARLLGFKTPEEAVGKTILTGDRPWSVVGVVGDYHQKSLRHALEPIIFIPAYSTYNQISVKVTSANLGSTVSSIRQKYDSFFPGNLFEYYFLDDNFNRQYENDQLFGKVFQILTGFAIFVACLGLFGLTMFSVVQRTKEIGVRKVLGASVSNILVLLSKDFITLVAVACLIAFPLAWWVMNNWLGDFSYRVTINAWVFVLAGISALLIALLTMSFQAIKAAFSNPVKSLRTE